jgi:glutamate--cysteine ligase
VVCLERGLREAGFEVRVGSTEAGAGPGCVTMKALEGELAVHPLSRLNGRVEACGFEPDLIISNNDFTEGVPPILAGISQPVVPAPGLGWHRRRKHVHFEALNDLHRDFGELVGLDPALISTRVAWVGGVDFDDGASRDRVAAKVEDLIAEIRADYRARGIPEEPFVFIKNDAGTYGMAVMTARSGDEVRKATHRTRTKMRMGKGRSAVSTVLIQEGLITRDLHEGSPMEPVIYLVGAHPVGGFYRIHRERSPVESLNVRGMEFRKLCFHETGDGEMEPAGPDCHDAGAALAVYGVLARLAALALGREGKRMEREGGGK